MLTEASEAPQRIVSKESKKSVCRRQSRLPGRQTTIAKCFRRQLDNRHWRVGDLWVNYRTWLKQRLDIDRWFIVNLTDQVKPYTREMEHFAWVGAADQDRLATGYW